MKWRAQDFRCTACEKPLGAEELTSCEPCECGSTMFEYTAVPVLETGGASIDAATVKAALDSRGNDGR